MSTKQLLDLSGNKDLKSSEECSKWYDERIVFPSQFDIDKYHTELLRKMTTIFVDELTTLRIEINKLREEIINLKELKIREQNRYIRQHMPIPFFPIHSKSLWNFQDDNTENK